MAAQSTILLVCDDPTRRAGLERALDRPEVELIATTDVPGAEAALGRAAVDAVVADIRRSPRETGTLLHVLRERAERLPVVVIHSDTSETPAELVRQGAFAVVPEGGDGALLIAWLQRAAEQHALSREVARLRRELGGPRDRVPLLGRSEGMRVLSQQLDELAARTTPVLLLGERGTGRRLVARELHARSARSSGPLVSLSVAGLADRLAESQLFGHRRGAFPGAASDHDGAFQQASGGTLLIVDVDRLTPGTQERIAKVLETGRVTPLGAEQPVEIDVRLACASERDLGVMARGGTFRDDLMRRLAGGRMDIPPLRKRPEDIVFLGEAFAAETAGRFDVSSRRFDPEAQRAMTAYPWPGNVTELREAVEHAFAHGVGEVVRIEHLPPSVRAGAKARRALPTRGRPTLADSEAWLVALHLEDAGGNKTEAARRLGIDRKRLYRKIRKYGLLGDEDVGEEE